MSFFPFSDKRHQIQISTLKGILCTVERLWEVDFRNRREGYFYDGPAPNAFPS